MSDTPKCYRGVQKLYDNLPDEVKASLPHFEKLMLEFPSWDISLAYISQVSEYVHNMILYIGAIKRWRCHKDIAYAAITNEELRKNEYKIFFNNIYEKRIPTQLNNKFDTFWKVRNKIMHGKTPSENDKRKAIVSFFEYATELNNFIYSIANFKPFRGSYQGILGPIKTYDKKPSHVMMMGLGFFKKSHTH